jgi:pimeloyl-ACP methyl ester carboxylesterase
MLHAKHSPLYAEQLGNGGTPLLMLHGWSQSLQQLKPLGELLIASSQVHLVDLPGFGSSKAPDGVWSAFDYADRLIAYLDEHNIPQADLFGHSFGGKVAMCAAIRYPNRVRRLVLAAPSGLFRHRTLLQQCRFKMIKWSGKALKMLDRCCGSQLFSTYFVPRYGSKDYQQAGHMRSILVRSVNEDLSSEIGSIQASTLIIWGEQDSETPPEMAHRLQSLIPSSHLLLLPYKGHNLFHDVGAHLCAYHILPFLQRKDAN